METIVNPEGLGRLLSNFSLVSGMRFTLLDTTGRIVYASYNLVPFCARMNETEEGAARCRSCDARSSRTASKSGGVCIAPCHAGLVDAVLPVVQNGRLTAYLFFGQVLDAAQTRESAWARTRAALRWYPDPDAFREDFFRLQQYRLSEMRAYANILSYCMPYLWLEGLVGSSEATSRQRLEAYIEANYASRVTLAGMSEALHLSKTKLCEQARAQGATVMQLVTGKRMEVAKHLLRATDYPVAVIAERVGIPDYNYFTKVFQKHAGCTPRAYRAGAKKREEPSGT